MTVRMVVVVTHDVFNPWCIVGPFIKGVPPGEIKDYLILPLDCWSGKKNKPDKNDSTEEEELKNLTL